MKSLKEIKSIIFKTECKGLVYDGLSRSEPVMTLGEKGIIDNYFVYAANHDQTEVSRPMVAFGIYSDLEEMAYINPDVYNQDVKGISNTKDRSIISEEYIKEYEKLYEEVRAFVQERCSDVQKSVLREYAEHLYNLSGTGLWMNYKEIAPQFFGWLEEEGIVIN